MDVSRMGGRLSSIIFFLRIFALVGGFSVYTTKSLHVCLFYSVVFHTVSVFDIPLALSSLL